METHQTQSYPAVAAEILKHLGGKQFIVMTGAKTLATIPNGLLIRTMKGRGGINCVQVRLNGLDLYDVDFCRIRRFDSEVVEEFQDVYADDLRTLFESTTGLLTKL